jgi:hypothetical protein
MVVYQVVVPLGKVLSWIYLLGKWFGLFNPFALKAGFGGVPDSFPSSLAYPLSTLWWSGNIFLLQGKYLLHYY